MCFELGEKQSITCVTLLKWRKTSKKRTSGTSEQTLPKGRGKTENAEQALEQVKTSGQTFQRYHISGYIAPRVLHFSAFI